jgi:hypothetical protein
MDCAVGRAVGRHGGLRRGQLFWLTKDSGFERLGRS